MNRLFDQDPTPDLIRLRDGSSCRIRPSQGQDGPHVQACFNALAPESRRLRFFAHKSALNPDELAYFAHPDGQDHIAMAALRLDVTGAERDALGFARCIRLAPGSDTAELSITVVDAAQGQGIGRALLQALISAARAAGIRHLRCEVLMENAGMRRLADALGGEPRWLGDGTLEYDCDLPSPPAPDWTLPWYADPTTCINAGTEFWHHVWFSHLDTTLRLWRGVGDVLCLRGQSPDKGRAARGA